MPRLYTDFSVAFGLASDVYGAIDGRIDGSFGPVATNATSIQLGCFGYRDVTAHAEQRSLSS